MNRSWGNARFPFDVIDAVVTAKAKIFLKSRRGIWTAHNFYGKLIQYVYMPFPNSLQGRKTLIACPTMGAGLKVGAIVHHIATDFPEMSNIDCDPKPQLVAVEDQWRWYFDQGNRDVFFKARTGEGWSRTDRLMVDGRFADDVATSIVAYDQAIYTATRMGILRF